MTTYNDNGTDKPNKQSDPNRDKRGRWKKGYSPNPKGRPRKKPPLLAENFDIHTFGNTVSPVRENNESIYMTNRTIFYQKVHQDAINGSASARRMMDNMYTESDRRLAEARVRYDFLLTKWIVENEQYKTKGEDSIPLLIRAEIRSLQTMLKHYYPSRYPEVPELPGKSQSDSSNEVINPDPNALILQPRDSNWTDAS